MYSIIDIETTGGNAWTDRITEVAVFVHDGQQVVKKFSSLVNPERRIPPFVARLTGITDEMVQDAPFFHEIARDLVELTEDTVFVGHNVQFDYSFIRQEFKNLGYQYDRQTLCTCKLSRKLIPGHPSYSLGRLCEGLGIRIKGRHRAAGDAEATVELFEKLLQEDFHGEFEKALKPTRFALLPECLGTEKVYSLPERPGVYYFHDEAGEIIYIGKSKNIRKRVLSHFKKKAPLARDARIRKELADITFQQTGTELIALLLETEEIKMHQPRFNRAHKTLKFPFGIFDLVNQDGYLTLFADKLERQAALPVASFKSLEQSLHMLHKKALEYGLCPKLTGIEKGAGPCFHFQVKKCSGACCGNEPVEAYNKRVESLLESFYFKNPSFVIIDHGRNAMEKSVVSVENGRYAGFGYFDASLTGSNIEAIRHAVKPFPDHPDSRYLIHSYLQSDKKVKVHPF